MSTPAVLARRVSLTQYLVEQQRKHGHISAELRLLIEVVSRACKSIAIAVDKGALDGVLGSADSENVQGEVQKKLSEEDFLQPGRRQAAAGCCAYGPQATLVLTFGDGVAMCTLDRETGSFVLTQEDVRIPDDTCEFAINMSNRRHWGAPVELASSYRAAL